MRALFIVTALPLALLTGCQERPSEATAPRAAPPTDRAPAAPALDKTLLGAFAPLPEGYGVEAPSAAQVDLGRQLYFDERLSKNQDVSCNSCHDLARYGVDGEKTSPGHKAQRGGRNSPTVYNAAGHFAQFWDGRAKDVEEQALGPILNPVEMAMPDEASVLRVVRSIPGYVEAFQKAFPGQKDPVTYANLGVAIGAFERGLVTPGRFDKLLAGDASALTAAEQKGLQTFVSTGCAACHAGSLVGGAMYQKLGLVKPWPNVDDKGRSAITNNDAEAFFFKVPSLRNVAKTGPWFHDGSVGTLEEAVKLMASHQLGRELTDEATAEIVTFLGALTGELPTAYIEEPTLPPSGPQTPAPDPS